MTSETIGDALPVELARELAAEAERARASVAGIGPAAVTDAEILAFVEGRGILLGAGGLPRRDGKPHRYATEGHTDRKDATILRWPDGGGWLQVHGADPKPVFFRGGRTRRLSRAARARIEEERQAREVETATKHAKAARRAIGFLAACDLASDKHPYLKRKRVPSFCLRISSDATLARAYGLQAPVLVVPVVDPDGRLASLEFIDVNGAKRFLAGGRKTGCSFSIGHPSGKPGERICLCEGYATGASIYEATRYPTTVAFDCGNLLPVAKALRAQYPKARIIICADDDSHRPGNPGLTHANEAARSVGGLVAKPGFGSPARGRGSHER